VKGVNANCRGFAIVSAIVLVVALALLGLYMVTVSGVGGATVNQSLLAARAYYGARAGLEWGIHRAVSPPAGSGLCAASSSFTPSGSGLIDMQVAVTCSTISYTVAGDTYYVYFLTSTGRYGTSGTADYAERKLEATVCRSTIGSSVQC
jgi:MSHA biogenesis protein MshP